MILLRFELLLKRPRSEVYCLLSIHACTGSSAASASGRRLRKKLSNAIILCPDGRQCKTCGLADNAADPVVVMVFSAWGYPPREDGTSVGDHCWYCVKVWAAVFKHKMSLKQVVAASGSDPALFQQFNGFVKKLKGHLASKGTRAQQSI